jgi:hypothetical protein
MTEQFITHELFGQLQIVGVFALWGVTALRVPAVLHQPAQRPLWFAVTLAATAISLQIQSIFRTCVRTLDISPHTATLGREFLGLFAATAILDFVLQVGKFQIASFFTYPLASLILIALFLMDLQSGSPSIHVVPSDSSRAPAPCTAYWVTLLTYHLVANAAGLILCWTSSRNASHGPLRVGFRLFAMGIGFAELLMALSLLHLWTRWSILLDLFPTVTGLESVFYAAGASVPLVQISHRTLQNLKVIYKLHPFWRTLVAAVPEIALKPPHGRIRDTLSFLLNSKFHVYRINIEVHDALLVLSGRVPATVLLQARTYVEAENLSANATADAALVACWVTFALHAAPAFAARQDAVDLSEMNRGDLEDDMLLLLDIAEIYQSSLPRVFLASASSVHGIISGPFAVQ